MLHKMHKLRFTTLCMCGVIAFSGNVAAQNLPTLQELNQIQGTIRQLDQQQADRLQRSTGPRASSQRPEAPQKQAQSEKQKKKLLCFEVETVLIRGYEPLGDPPVGYDRLVGKCATVVDLSDLLNDLNVAYQDKGLITTRAYLPRQNLADGSLEIVIIPGRINRFDYGVNRASDSRVATAFPVQPKDMLNLRDLEQGLENFNRVPSQSAKFKLYPGQEPGQSIVRLEEKNDKPWRVSVGLDNSGGETTGKYKATVGVGVDNILNINDILTVQVSGNVDRDDGREPRFPLEIDGPKYSEAVTASYSFPIGYWSFFTSLDLSRYFFVQDGVNQDYEVRGHSSNIKAGAELLIKRTQNEKTYIFGDLAIKRSQNFIADFEIMSQRRELTIGQLGMRGVAYLPNAEWQISVYGKFGLPILGAQQPLSTVLKREFQSFHLSGLMKTRIGETGWSYANSFAFQASMDELPGAEQFSVGGRSTVRGFQEDTIYGNTGGFMRNEISSPEWKQDILSAQAYAGLDVGFISGISVLVQGDENPDNGVSTSIFSQSSLAGLALGIRGTLTKYLSYDFSYARSLSRPEEFSESQNLIYFSTTANY